MAEAPTRDERLDWIIRGLDSTGWAAEVCDADWRLVWVAPQTREIIGAGDDGELGLGEHILESRKRQAWQRMVSLGAQRQWIQLNVPQMLADDPDSKERLAELTLPELRDAVMECEPAQVPLWTWLTDTTGVVPSARRVRNFGLRVRTRDGEPLSTVYMYGANLPATLLALVSQGDRGMFERMARLAEPGRREAAVLFADIQSSGELSRHLSSAAYFRLVHDLFTTLDGIVIGANGIVGKHAGDGISAFFLADDCDSKEGATGAAVDAAIALVRAARDAGDGVTLNVGVHWGGALYMGQVVTGGRLEVTALGDEVNECARIQESARDGIVLASKPLIERLDPDHAKRIGIDPDNASYTTVAELSGAPREGRARRRRDLRHRGALRALALAVERRHPMRGIALAGRRARPAPRCSMRRSPRASARRRARRAPRSAARGVRAPTSGTMSSPRDSTQAIAICATVDPASLGDRRAAPRPAPGCASRFSPWKRGRVRRGSRRPASSRSARPVAADQPAREHAVGGHADAELPARGQDLVLDAARDQRVLDLQVADRVHGAARRIVSGADLRQPDVADVAGLDHLGDGADRLLDRHAPGRAAPGGRCRCSRRRAASASRRGSLDRRGAAS